MSDQKNERKPPTPEELEKDFAEFLNKKYGGQVQVGVVMPGQQGRQEREVEPPGDEEKNEDKIKRILEFDMTPREVKAYLDRFVIGQEDAKRALSIAVCDHYNHIREDHENPDSGDQEYSKQNVLMVGPTGVGKTYLIRTLAKLIGVPFVKADATKFSETGYVGGNVEDLVRDLATQAGGDVALAQYGIIYLDEVDKIASPRNLIGRDVSGRGVQMNLLKLLEDADVDLRSPFDPASQMEAVMEFQRKGKTEKPVVNTGRILFIVSGAFMDIADIVKKRLNRSMIGFGGNVDRDEDADYTAQARSDDFVKYGFEPEFIGRLPVRVFCHDLNVEHLFEILNSSEGSIIRQYERAFKAYGIEAVFEEDGLRAVAERSKAEQTGARGLMTVCERLFRDFKFEMPGTEAAMLVVDKALVEDPQSALNRLLNDDNFRRQSAARSDIKRFADEFQQANEIELAFQEEAVDALVQKAANAERSVYETAAELFKDYANGLGLIQQKTNQTRFEIGAEVVRDPDAALNEWIRASYAKQQTSNESSGS